MAKNGPAMIGFRMLRKLIAASQHAQRLVAMLGFGNLPAALAGRASLRAILIDRFQGREKDDPSATW